LIVPNAKCKAIECNRIIKDIKDDSNNNNKYTKEFEKFNVIGQQDDLGSGCSGRIVVIIAHTQLKSASLSRTKDPTIPEEKLN
jgi:hypothetical protein